MKTLIKHIKQKNPVEILISINVILFFFSVLLHSFRIFNFSWVALPYDFKNYINHFWTIITYTIFHNQFISLVFNMILLFYFGNVFLDFASSKKFIKVFFTGAIIGGIFFMSSYNFFSEMFVNKGSLLGASAGVMSVMTYISTKMPHYQIHIRFLGYFKLIHILIFFIIFNLLQIPLGNPGGYFAHLGGLLAGFMWFIYDKYLYLNKSKKTVDINSQEVGKNYKINLILEKISRSGYDSLTDEEKEYLFRQGKK